MSTERSEVDMIFIGLTIHYVYLQTIWYLRNVEERNQIWYNERR